MKTVDDIIYSEYGEGSELLFAFHGYGMDGNQFQTLKNSIARKYRIIGFHLPYHPNGPSQHEGWTDFVAQKMLLLLHEKQLSSFAMAGYSIGARICLQLVSHFPDKIKKLYLFAPYGLERHWGLSFVTHKFGNRFFKTIVNTRFPEKIMLLIKAVGVVDDTHNQIIQNELNTPEKRLNLCQTLFMAGQIKIDLDRLIKILNNHRIEVLVTYGKSDVLFPHKKRNQKLLDRIDKQSVLAIDEGHWLMTPQLDYKLSETLR